jgi:hypothetical protein
MFRPINLGFAKDIVNLPVHVREKIGPEAKNGVFAIIGHR